MTVYEKMRLACLTIPEGSAASPEIPGRWAMVSGRVCHLLANKCAQAADKEKTTREKGRITKNYGIILLTFFGKCV